MFKTATFQEILLSSSGNVNDYVAHIKGNMRTFMETTKLPDKGEAAQCKLHNFYLSISFIVSVKVSIFPLNMHDMIIYVAR